MMNRMVIMIGLQASGKSTFCKSYLAEYKHISLDDLNTRNKERLAVMSCIENHEDLVIDNTNPSAEDRKKYFEMAKGSGYRIIGYYMRSVIAECIPRNEQRTGKARIPTAAIAATSKKIELPTYDEGFDELYYAEITDNGFEVSEWRKED